MQHNAARTTRNLALLGVAGAVALTGCGSSSKSAGGLSGGSTSATSAAASGGASGGTVKIGFEGPLSGDNAQLGINEYNAAELAVEQANQKNTFGFQVTLVKSDDVGDPAKAPAAATSLQQ